MYKKIILKRNQDKRIRSGYLWIFSNEIENIDNGINSGDLVGIHTIDKRFIGIGFYNSSSLIAARILSRHEDTIDKDFFEKKINNALNYRKAIYPNLDSFRLVFGEADFLPGLIVDKYEENLSIKIMAKGMYNCLTFIIEALEDIIKPENIFFSIDEEISRFENVPVEAKWIKGKNPGKLIISENALQFYVNMEEGQKTGFFFDQKDNRYKLKNYVIGKSVLDCFCYTGSFSVYTSFFGAEEIYGIDSSEKAIFTAKENVEINNVRNCNFIKDDVFNYIKNCMKIKKKFYVVLLDPPGLIKSKKNFYDGYNKYVELNSLALQIIEKDGYLITSSCSNHLDFNSFLKMISEASKISKRKIQIIEFGFQAKDHPILPSMPETMYLKTAFCKVL